MALVILKITSTLLAVFLSLVSIFVDLRIPERRRLRLTCMSVLLISAAVLIATQVIEINRQESSTKRSLAQLLRISTRVQHIELEAELFAPKDAVLPTIWECLPVGDKYIQIHSEAIDLRTGASLEKRKCPSTSPRIPVTVVVDLCKSRAPCHAAQGPDVSIDFADSKKEGEKPCLEPTIDRATSQLRIAVECSSHVAARPYIESISLNDIRTGSIRIAIVATPSTEFPNAALLDKAELQSVTVELNGIPIKINAKDCEKSLVGSGFEYTYDLKPEDLQALD
jgi:hypothetical protein